MKCAWQFNSINWSDVQLCVHSASSRRLQWAHSVQMCKADMSAGWWSDWSLVRLYQSKHSWKGACKRNILGAVGAEIQKCSTWGVETHLSYVIKQILGVWKCRFQISYREFSSKCLERAPELECWCVLHENIWGGSKINLRRQWI